jgi:hypothetical protein
MLGYSLQLFKCCGYTLQVEFRGVVRSIGKLDGEKRDTVSRDREEIRGKGKVEREGKK